MKNEKINVIAVLLKKGEIQDIRENEHTEPYIPFGNLLPNVDNMITNGDLGGQYKMIIEDLNMVIVFTASDYNGSNGRANSKVPMIIEEVIPLFD